MPFAQLLVEERLQSGTPERIQRFSYLPPEPFNILLVNEAPYRPHRTDPSTRPDRNPRATRIGGN